ncbi:molybdopterin molybdenumtransferase MoeA [Lentibacter algarum]|uniref:molybdenum cofactor synthesis domain-containing protein n=1 Tax=Lentibacter algarum TaxID=576131 RepID=UPI001C068F4A|nr:gephyrin-like molybdotransferase Glp [Lentibacter algarum]MBU2981868.1 molybdopterin molybdenumtransferase MoeA [Lentibacter algarum]
MSLKPPPLRDDCFALPAGVDWTPVDVALAELDARLHPVKAVENVALSVAVGRVLASDIKALRSNPPLPNSAVDGYGFAFAALGEGDQLLPLVKGRAAAGLRFEGRVPEGHAIRILTGAALPDGVDTVILEEDVNASQQAVAFRAGVKPNANTRKAGEDVVKGDICLQAGKRLGAADLALAAAVGHGVLPVYERLKVGVLSTGDEIVEPGQAAQDGQIFDANRVMLLSLLEQMGFDAVNLGLVRDDREVLRARLNSAEVDVIITSGGASAGDEDHVSALLRDTGSLNEWRIAIKPGRPLALGVWNGTPVFGLPGNPVAALVCLLVFARPALGKLAGNGWLEPQGFSVPAGFSKRKKAGRREYLRARMRQGRVEVFASEGSGRISGLSWAEGLVVLPDEAADIAEGDAVTFLPFSSFI